MAKMFYNLKIKSLNAYDIKNIMVYGECLDETNYQYKIIDGDDQLDILEEYVLYHYLNLLEKNIEKILKIDKDIKITLWMTYEYDDQCNMEFSTADIKRMSDLGIFLCISAYQSEDDSEQ